MLSDSGSQEGKNSEHNVFSGIPVRPGQEVLFSQFLDGLSVGRLPGTGQLSRAWVPAQRSLFLIPYRNQSKLQKA